MNMENFKLHKALFNKLAIASHFHSYSFADKMKRSKESGASFRKRRKAKEDDMKRNDGSLLKYLDHETSTADVQSKTPHDKSGYSLKLSPVPGEMLENMPSTSGISDIDAVYETNLPLSTSALEVSYQCNLDQPMYIIDEQRNQSEPDINLKDVGLWPSKITDNTRIYVVQQGASVVQNINANFGEIARGGSLVKGQNRKLTREWFFRTLPNGEKVLRSWLVYSPSKKAVYCFCCRLFANKSISQFEGKDGFNTWWKLNPKLPDHESSTAHVRCFAQWKELEIRLRGESTIDKKEQEQINCEIKKWRGILSRLLDIIRFLAKQNLALRGHREGYHDADDEQDSTQNRGNFLELVDLLAKYDPVLREHTLRIKLGKKFETSYLSPTIQNEFIEILGEKVREIIIKEVKEAKYFSMMFDSTPDVSHKDQISQVLRYVKINENKVVVVETFIDFVEMQGKSSKDIATLIMEKLKRDKIDIQNCRGQAYDNAAVMAGHYTGVQMRIKEVNPHAAFTACTNHSLNLAGVHAASVSVNSVTFFGTIERLYAFFAKSTHRWNILTSVTGRSVKRLVETRWCARGDAVNVVKQHYASILHVAEQLTGEELNASTRSDAGVLLNALQSFPFLCFLGLWEAVLKEINDTQVYLQRKEINITECDFKLYALQQYLLENRDQLICNAITYAKKICDEVGIARDRRQRKKKMMPGEKTQDTDMSFEAELRREMFSSLDRVAEEIRTRFQQIHRLAEKYAFLTPSNLLNVNYVCKLENHPDVDEAEFHIERQRLQNFVSAASTVSEISKGGPLQLLQFIVYYRLQDSVPNIVILLRIFLTIAVSVATCERSFSKLKLIKNYLRSTMSTLRLRNLAILSIEREISDVVDFDEVINDFSIKKARKITL